MPPIPDGAETNSKGADQMSTKTRIMTEADELYRAARYLDSRHNSAEARQLSEVVK